MLLLSTSSCGIKKNNYIINVSYDATREFYADYNDMFVKHWKDIKGGARWNYLAAWAYFEDKGLGQDEIVVPSVSITCLLRFQLQLLV